MNEPLSTDFLQSNVLRMRSALDHHNETCPHAPIAFRLHPYDLGVLPFGHLWGVALVGDETVSVKAFRIECPIHGTTRQASQPTP